MPEAYNSDYEKWSREFARLEVNENTILVGHSCGGGFLLRWLSENQVKIKKLILVAPWLDPGREKTTDFFDFKIDQHIKERIGEIHLLVSKDDAADILESVAIIKNGIADIIYHEFINHGHFCFSDMKIDKFPELLSYILE